MDGSSKFGADNRYGFFPAVSGAWILSEESFIPDAFSNLKLRVGYGITGNQEIPHNLYQSRERYAGIETNDAGDITPNNPGLGVVAYANPELKWEQTSQINLGLDFGSLMVVLAQVQNTIKKKQTIYYYKSSLLNLHQVLMYGQT